MFLVSAGITVGLNLKQIVVLILNINLATISLIYIYFSVLNMPPVHILILF